MARAGKTSQKGNKRPPADADVHPYITAETVHANAMVDAVEECVRIYSRERTKDRKEGEGKASIADKPTGHRR